jgi:hypothetical protein
MTYAFIGPRDWDLRHRLESWSGRIASLGSGQRLRNVPIEVHPLVQDAHDVRALWDESIEQEVRAASNFVVARTDA